MKNRMVKLIEFKNIREKEVDVILSQIINFTNVFYSSLERWLCFAAESDTGEISTQVKRQDIGGNLESFSFEWSYIRILVLPNLSIAYPSQNSKMASSCFHGKMVGRIVIFFQDPKDETITDPIADLHFDDKGNWCYEGIIGHSFKNSFDKNTIDDIAISLLESIFYRIELYHQSLQDTHFEAYRRTPLGPIGFKQ